MERLTMLIDSHLLDNGKLDKEYSLNNKMEFNDFSCMDIPNAVYNKLGELEDVLEKYGIESAKKLDNVINSIKTNTLIDMENKEMLELENVNLKNELAELKQKAIVPKFQICQTLYMIPTQFNGLTKIKEYNLLSVGLSDIGIRYDIALKEKERGIEPYYCASEDMFGKSIFATKEEAEQKLAEIKGEK